MIGFFNNAWDTVLAVLLFGAAIFIHELGHFLVALRCGLVVQTFSIGFGPSIVEWKRKGITYKICWIPLGGYVALPQLDPTGMAMVQGSTDETTGKKEEDKPLPYVSPWAKILVSVAGAGGNMVLALAIAVFIFLSPSIQPPNQDPLFISVDADSPAYKVGLRTGQEILAVNGTSIRSWYNYHEEILLPKSDEAMFTLRVGDTYTNITVTLTQNELTGRTLEGMHEASGAHVEFVKPGSPAEKAGILVGDTLRTIDGIAIKGREQFLGVLEGYEGKTASLVVTRNEKEETLSITPTKDPEQQKIMIGVAFAQLGPAAPWLGSKGIWEQISGDARSVQRLLKALTSKDEFKQAAGSLGGVPTIGYMIFKSVQMGPHEALAFLRFLCVNLAILNLLPIPLLDGGHVLFCLWEGITRRRVHPKVANALVNTFGALLITALLYINVRDVFRLPKILKMVEKQNAAEAATPTNAASVAPAPQP